MLQLIALRCNIYFLDKNVIKLFFRFYDKVKPDVMAQIYQYYRWDFVLMGYTKLSNPNFPYLDFDQDFDKEFDLLGEEDAMSSKTEPPG